MLMTITVVIFSTQTFLSTLDFKYFCTPLLILRQTVCIFLFLLIVEASLQLPKIPIRAHIFVLLQTDFHAFSLAQKSIFSTAVGTVTQPLYYVPFFLSCGMWSFIINVCYEIALNIYACLNLDVIEPSIIQIF